MTVTIAFLQHTKIYFRHQSLTGLSDLRAEIHQVPISELLCISPSFRVLRHLKKDQNTFLAVFRCLLNFPLKSVPLAKVSDDCSLLTDYSDLGKPFFS